MSNEAIQNNSDAKEELPEVELSAYEQRVAAKRERLSDRAAAAKALSESTYSTAKHLASAIPFGQPILVGHYSEGRDRRYRARIHDKFGQAFAQQDRAAELARRAESYGTHGISSDDDKAIPKLEEKLSNLMESQNLMKAANAVIRRRGKKTDAEVQAQLVGLGLSAAVALETIKPDFAGRIGFPSYALSNNNANIRRVQQRIAELKTKADRQTREVVGSGYVYREDVEDNRLHFVFEGKPDDDVRSRLRRDAFKWSPSRGAWVRMITPNARGAAKMLLQWLDDRG